MAWASVAVLRPVEPCFWPPSARALAGQLVERTEAVEAKETRGPGQTGRGCWRYHRAVILEPLVRGRSGMANGAGPSFLRGVQKRVRQGWGPVESPDEVMTGPFGRTGSLFAAQAPPGLQPDAGSLSPRGSPVASCRWG